MLQGCRLNTAVSNMLVFLMTHLEYVKGSSFMMIFDVLFQVVNRTHFNADTSIILFGVITSLFL